jgi:hypothetical protein
MNLDVNRLKAQDCIAIIFEAILTITILTLEHKEVPEFL